MKPLRFFITGLPRSRTAWFSVATSGARSVCYHEPTHHIGSFGQLREFWEPSFGMATGMSDSALCPQLPRILSDIGPRTLIVERPLEESLFSFSAWAGKYSIAVDLDACRRIARLSLAAVEAARSHPLVKCVGYSDLQSPDVVMECLHWLLPGHDFPDARALMGMNIQIMPDLAIRRARKLRSLWFLETAEEVAA